MTDSEKTKLIKKVTESNDFDETEKLELIKALTSNSDVVIQTGGNGGYYPSYPTYPTYPPKPQEIWYETKPNWYYNPTCKTGDAIGEFHNYSRKDSFSTGTTQADK